MIVRALVLLALLVRLLPAPAAVAVTVLPDAIPICHSDGTAGPVPADGRPTHPDACALCPLCLTVAQGAVLPTVLSAMPLPSVTAPSDAMPPPATGPPQPPRLAARPRAPPV